MGLGTRFILGICGILIIAVGIFSVGIYLNLIDVSGTILANFAGQEATAITGLVFLIVGLAILGVSFKGANKEDGKKVKSIIQYNERGEINISFQAIENMVLRVSRDIHGIKETSTKVSVTEQGMVIELHVKVLPDLQIPPLAAELQGKIKEYVEDKTGMPVNEVSVSVENIVVDEMGKRRS